MKNLKTMSACLMALILSNSILLAQDKKSEQVVEGKMKVVIVKDENGKVEEVNREFDLEDQEEMEKFLKQQGVELKINDLSEDIIEDGRKVRLKVIEEIEDNGSGEEERIMIMRVNTTSDKMDDSKENFEFNWVSDSVNESNKLIELVFPAHGVPSENVFIFSDELHEGDSLTISKSFVFIRKDGVFEEDESLNTGIKEQKLNNMPIENLKMYPNPNDGNFSSEFSVTEKSDVLITITDSKGAMIYEKELNGFSGRYKEDIDLSKEDSGLYFYNLRIGDKIETNKIILQ